jgi:type II secretion system protein G
VRMVNRQVRRLLTRQQGFTLIELLIVIAILGVLAGIVIPNVNSFVGTGTMNAANTELENVRIASVAYRGNFDEWPKNSDNLTEYLSDKPKAKYYFNADTGYVTNVSDVTWSGIEWSAPPGPPYSQHGEWKKQ